MGIAIKNFLADVKQHDEAGFRGILPRFHERYESASDRVFGDWDQRSDPSDVLQTVAEDMHYLVEYYATNRDHNDRSTYKALATEFEQQCEVSEKNGAVKVSLRMNQKEASAATMPGR